MDWSADTERSFHDLCGGRKKIRSISQVVWTFFIEWLKTNTSELLLNMISIREFRKLNFVEEFFISSPTQFLSLFCGRIGFAWVGECVIMYNCICWKWIRDARNLWEECLLNMCECAWALFIHKFVLNLERMPNNRNDEPKRKTYTANKNTNVSGVCV